MLNRFAKVENALLDFSQLFQKYLSKKYDHLSEEEVFSSNGKIKKEIFDSLKHSKNFDDIRKLIKTFNDSGLNDLVEKCEPFVEDGDKKASTEISDCLRECIIDTTENYTTSLLTFRHQALNAFDHFEKNLHDLLSTYGVIQNRNLTYFMEQRLNKPNNLPDNTNNNYCNDYLDFYRNFVNDLDGEFKERASVIKKILNENNHTLKPYFKQKINNIRNLLTSYVHWYKLESFRKDEYDIFQIKTTSAILSRILDVIKSKYSDCFCPNNEIRIINSNKLYIDSDLSSSKYLGVNIVLVSPYQELVQNKTKLEIITNGKDAKDIWSNNPAKNGIGTDQNRKGNKGEDECDGKPRKSAGHVYIVANELPKIDALRGGAWSYRNHRIGTDGQPGGWGGDAGSGRYRGNGGHPGLVKFVALDDISEEISYKSSPGKSGSGDGQSGQPGKAGKHAKDGLEYAAISNWINLFKAAVTGRNSTDLKGGRRYSSERRYLNEKKLLEEYNMRIFEIEDNN
ncbi:unnamed protein product, partial [Didymodactylos carnosus]